MPAENNNLKDLKIALGKQVNLIHKKYEGDIQRLKDKIKQIEKDRAYLQAKTSITTAKINREYRQRLLELDCREKEILQKQYVLDERENRLNKQLEEKDGIIQSLNVHAMETETNLTVEFNQKLRSKEWEILRLSDEIKVLNRILKGKEKESQSKVDVLTGEIHQLREKTKKESLSLSSQFAVERGEFEREKFTLQQNIKALKNTINSLKEGARKVTSEYEDRLKVETLTAAEESSNLQNRISEIELENDALQKKLEDVRLRTGMNLQETEKKYQKQIQNLTSEVQSARQEIALLGKGNEELRSINEATKDNYNQKISDIEATSRAVEIELRNRLMEKESEIERLEKMQKGLEEKSSGKISKVEKENLALQKALEAERDSMRELENKYSAEYLAQTSEKKHLQEMYGKEIATLKERILQRATAMSSMESAYEGEKTNLKIKISGLLDDLAASKEQAQQLQKEKNEISEENAARICSLNLLIKDREKESESRFSEISEKYKVLTLNRQNDKENYQKAIEEKEEKLSQVLQELETVKLNSSIALSAKEKEREQQCRALQNRIDILEENLKNTVEKMRDGREKHLLLLKDKERQYEANMDEARREVASRDDLLFRQRDDNRRKLLEKDQTYSVEIDNLRRIILQNSGEFQKEKDGLSEKIRALQNKINETENIHRKEIAGLNALRVSEKDALHNTIAQLNANISRLTEGMEDKKSEISALTEAETISLSRIEALTGEKRNISQSLNALLSEKQNVIEKLTVQIDTLKNNFFDTLEHREAENRRLLEEINGLKAGRTDDEEKLKNIRETLEQANKNLSEEVANFRNRLAAQKIEFEKKVEVLVIEKVSGIDKLKTIISTRSQEMQTLKSENRITSENLKKHYLEMIAEKDKAFTREIDSYEEKTVELNGIISKLSAETEKMAERLRESAANFERKRIKVEQEKDKAIDADKARLRKSEEEFRRVVSRLQERVDAQQRESVARQDTVRMETEQMRKQLTESRVLRETELGKWNEQRREIENQLKIQDMRLKEEIKKSRKTLSSAEAEVTDLKEQAQKADAEWKEKSKSQESSRRREIAVIQEQIDKMKDEINRIYKASADEKQALSENFADRTREQDSKFNAEKMKLMNDLRDLRDINRALEEELSGIRTRLDAAKRGV